MRAWSTIGDDGAVQVQGPDGEILGSGFLMDRRRVLTCAHVVEGLDEVRVVFLAAPSEEAKLAAVSCRVYDGKGHDIAVLELKEAPPRGARPLRLEAPQAGGRFRTFGFPKHHDDGIWLQGSIIGRNLQGWFQIEPDGACGVEKGFSGGSAWSDEQGAAVGMIVGRSGGRVGWLIPGSGLQRLWTELSERRPFRSMAAPPASYMPRTEYSSALSALTASGGATIAMMMALCGAGGFGKTTLAQALATDPAIRTAFPDGVLWTTMGENLRPADRVARVRDLLRWWSGEEPAPLADYAAACASLRDAIAGYRVLIVVDDVWDPEDVAPFQDLQEAATILVTTRVRHILSPGTTTFEIDALARDEAVTLLTSNLPAEATASHQERLRRLAARLGYWPLLLSLLNRRLVESVATEGLHFSAALKEAEESLDEYGLHTFDRDDRTARRNALDRTLAATLEGLSDLQRSKFFELAVFPDDVEVPLEMVELLWRIPRSETQRLCLRLRDLALVRQMDTRAASLRLHDAIRAYLRENLSGPEEELHQKFLDALRPPSGAWKDLPREPLYPWRHLEFHLIGAGCIEELRSQLFEHGWLEAKIKRLGANRSAQA